MGNMAICCLIREVSYESIHPTLCVLPLESTSLKRVRTPGSKLVTVLHPCILLCTAAQLSNLKVKNQDLFRSHSSQHRLGTDQVFLLLLRVQR